MAIYLDDKKFVRQLLEGDERAFDRFFEENFARLYRFALARLSDDPEAAREIAQITLTRALQNLHTYRAESALFTWLCAICRNETSEWLRKQARYRQHVVLTEDFPDIQAAVDSYRAPQDEGPEASYRRTESIRLIQVAMDRLPARYGDVLEWKYVDGCSVREIACRLELGQEATQSLLARARRAFGEVYETLVNGMNERTLRVKV